MTNAKLKWIAIITMLIDHAGDLIIPELVGYNSVYFLFRLVGRLAFPIFAFLIAEGYFHTRDVKKYMLRLFLFALISEIPFDLAFSDEHTWLEFGHQNVMFTLLLGLISVAIFDKLRKYNMIITYIIGILNVAGCAYIAYLIKSDYDFIGVLMVFGFYISKKSIEMTIITFILLSVSLSMYVGMVGNSITIYFFLQLFATLSIVIISAYNGEKGRTLKYFFYIFYPGHLIILYLIHTYYNQIVHLIEQVVM